MPASTPFGPSSSLFALGLALTKAGLVGLLFQVAVTLRGGVVDAGASGEPPWLTAGTSNLVIVLTTTMSWSLLGSAHRAAIIYLVSPVADRTIAVLRAAGVAAVLAVLDTILVIALSVLLFGVLHCPHVAGYLVAGYLLLWIASRGFIGISMAAALLGGKSGAGALSQSFRELAGRRAQSVASRAGVPMAAAIAALATAYLDDAYLLPALLVFDPLLITTDAVLEATLYERVSRAHALASDDE